MGGMRGINLASSDHHIISSDEQIIIILHSYRPPLGDMYANEVTPKPLYKHQTIIQASDYYTSIRLLYKHQTIIQASDYFTSKINMQAPDYHTGIRL